MVCSFEDGDVDAGAEQMHSRYKPAQAGADDCN
jgi:hypothetical protein